MDWWYGCRAKDVSVSRFSKGLIVAIAPSSLFVSASVSVVSPKEKQSDGHTDNLCSYLLVLFFPFGLTHTYITHTEMEWQGIRSYLAKCWRMTDCVCMCGKNVFYTFNLPKDLNPWVTQQEIFYIFLRMVYFMYLSLLLLLLSLLLMLFSRCFFQLFEFKTHYKLCYSLCRGALLDSRCWSYLLGSNIALRYRKYIWNQN